jgi:hypothetical protein
VRLIALTAHAAVVRNNAWLVGVRHLRSVPIRSGHHPPAAPSSLAEAKARFAASRDLATLQVAEIDQVALPSPPGFVVLPTEWSDPCDLRQVLRACPKAAIASTPTVDLIDAERLSNLLLEQELGVRLSPQVNEA